MPKIQGNFPTGTPFTKEEIDTRIGRKLMRDSGGELRSVRWISYQRLQSDADYKQIAQSVREINKNTEVSSGASKTWSVYSKAVLNPKYYDPQKHGVFVVENLSVRVAQRLGFAKETELELQFPAYAKVKECWNGNPNLVYVSLIAVDPGARGKGLAKQIIKQLFNKHPNKVLTLEVRNDPTKESCRRAVGFYNSLSSAGYAVRWEDEGEYSNGDPMRTYYFALDESTMQRVLGPEYDDFHAS